MAEEFTAKFRVDISDLKKNIAEANKEIKLADATFKAASAGMDDWASNADGLSAKLSSLDKILNSQKNVLSSYRQQLERQEKAYEENGSRAEQLKAKLQELADNGVKKTDDEYKKYESALKSVLKEQENNAKSIDQLKLSILNQEAAVGKTEKEIRKYDTQLSTLDSTSGKTEEALDELGDAAKKSGDDAKKGGDGYTIFKGVVADLAASAIKSAVSGLKRLGEGFINLTKDAIAGYGEMEQLKGGVEKLFGDDMTSVVQNANNAFKTAGLNANEYMETVTSFSASLISSLGGDTAKAAQYADTAISDMADNANTFGSDIGAIQTAYQGFAKQNYTMLDNLKLGYGGTKTEMERLITDAEGLSDTFTAQRDESGNLAMSYADIVDAIHIVQENMNITGTTAREASKTIEGSIASTKSAWQNLVNGLGDPSADIKQLAKNVVESAGNVITNVMPIIDNIVKAIPEALDSIIKEIEKANLIDTVLDAAEGIFSSLLKQLPRILKTFMSKVISLLPRVIKTISSILPELVSTVTTLVTELAGHINEFIQPILNALPEITKAIISAIPNLIQALAKEIPTVIDSILEVIPELILALAEELPSIVTSIVNELPTMLNQIVSSITEHLPEIIAVIPTLITSLVNALIEGLPQMIQGAIDLFMGIIKAIPTIVVEIAKAMPEIIGAIAKGLLVGVTEIFEAAVSLFGGVTDASEDVRRSLDAQAEAAKQHAAALEEIKPKIADYNKILSETGNTLGDLNRQQSEAENGITEVLRTALEEQRGLRDEDLISIQTYMDELNRINEEKMQIYRSQQLAELTKLQLESGAIDQETAQQHLANAQATLDAANKATEDAYTSRLTTIEQKYAAMNAVGSAAYQEELQNAKSAHDADIAENQTYYDSVLGILGEKSKDWVNIDSEKWGQLTEQMKAFSVNSDSELQNMLNSMGSWTGGFDSAKDVYLRSLETMDKQGAQGFLRMAANIKKSGGEIDTETQSIANSILGAFDNLPDNMDEAGKNTLLGIIAGMEDEISGLENTSEMTANEIVDTIKDYLGIASPSKVMAEIGEHAGEGLIQGIENKQAEAGRVVQQIGRTMLVALSDLRSQFFSAGIYMAQGVASGFDSQGGYVRSTIINMINRAIQGLRVELKIASPSKVMAEIGRYMALGVVKGVDSQKDNLKKSAAEMSQLYVDAARKRFDNYTALNNMVLTQQVAFWKEIVKRTKKGSDAYYTAAIQLKRLQDDLKTDITSISKTFASDVGKVETELANNIKSINKTLNENIKSLRDTYSKTVRDRANAITGSLQLFNAAKVDEGLSSKELLNNLKTQVSALKEWDSTLDSLKKRVKNAALLEELQSQGVGSLETLKSINKMSDKELAQYEKLYKQKGAIAKERATTESEKLLASTNAQIKKLQAAADKEIAAQQASANKQIAALRATYIKELAKLGVDGKKQSTDIGKNIASGIKSGFSSAMAEVTKSVRNDLNALLKAIKKQLKIASPSKVYAGIGEYMAEGLGVGFLSEMRKVNRDIQQALPTTAADALLAQLNGGMTAAAAGARTSNITFTQNNYSPKPLTRLEIYRNTQNILQLAGAQGNV